MGVPRPRHHRRLETRGQTGPLYVDEHDEDPFIGF